MKLLHVEYLITYESSLNNKKNIYNIIKNVFKGKFIIYKILQRDANFVLIIFTFCFDINRLKSQRNTISKYFVYIQN